MSLKGIEPGRYRARVKDWKIEVNPYLDKPEIVIGLDFEVAGEWHSIPMKILWLTKSDEVSKKAVNTLKTIGYTDEDPSGLNDFAVDTTKDFEVTITQDGNYLRAEWLNDPAEKKDKGPVPTAKKTLADFFPKAKGKVAAAPKNHAPKATPPPPPLDTDDSIPF